MTRSALLAALLMALAPAVAHGLPSYPPFPGPAIPTGGADTTGVAIGDLNGDQATDLVVTDGAGAAVRALLGDATGKLFAAGSVTSLSAAPSEPEIAQLDGQAGRDVAFASGASGFTWVAGDGAGGLSTPTTIATGGTASTLALANVAGNSAIDVVAGNQNSVAVLVNDGAGSFSPTIGSPYATGMTVQHVEVGDVNNDGNPDIVATGVADLAVLLNNGTGSFGLAPGSPMFVVGGGAVRSTIGHFAGSSAADIAVTNPNTNEVRFLTGAGDGTFVVSVVATNLFPGLRDIKTADFDGNGLDDVVVSHNDGFNVLYQSPAGVFITRGAGSVGISQANFVEAADLDRDGMVDVVGARAVTSADDYAFTFRNASTPSAQVTGPVDPFPDQQVGTIGPVRNMIVFNNGQAPLRIERPIFQSGNGDFLFAGGDCDNGPVPPGGSCTIFVRFAPLDTGLRQAIVGVQSNAPDSPGFPISGTGLQAQPGPAGPEGPAGSTGASGADGAAGPQGATGATGATGPKGDKGDPGAGVTGATIKCKPARVRKGRVTPSCTLTLKVTSAVRAARVTVRRGGRVVARGTGIAAHRTIRIALPAGVRSGSLRVVTVDRAGRKRAIRRIVR